MYVSQTVVGFLEQSDADFDILTHPHTACSTSTARTARVPQEEFAKAVVLSTQDEFLLALVPASRSVDTDAVAELLHAAAPMLADEHDLAFVFRDCERGAVPATGAAFGLPTIVDDSLLNCRDVYFEGGDHEHLVHMRGGEFARILTGQPHGPISC